MGVTMVKLKVRSLYDKTRQAEGDFLVDTGANHTVVPLEMTKKLGSIPKSKQDFYLADGTKITRKMTDCIVEFGNKSVPTEVVMGEKGDEALFGVLTLEQMGLVINPLTRKLRKMVMRM